MVLHFCGMIWHTLVKVAQRGVFLWYDMAYLGENGAQFCDLWYNMAYLSANSTKLCIFMV